MAEVTIRIDSAQVEALLDRGPRRVNDALRLGMEDAAALLLRTMKTYPPAISGSSYRRRNILLDSWSRDIQGSGISIRAEITSSGYIAPYNRYVQDREQQARVHRGRWITVQSAAERNAAGINRMFATRLRNALR
jgi:hypothetical protein